MVIRRMGFISFCVYFLYAPFTAFSIGASVISLAPGWQTMCLPKVSIVMATKDVCKELKRFVLYVCLGVMPYILVWMILFCFLDGTLVHIRSLEGPPYGPSSKIGGVVGDIMC
jgi:hypothetical protein